MASLLLTGTLAVALAVPTHWWPRLPAPVRRRLSLATSLAGLACLVAALRSEGLRESALTSLVLVGPATLTARAQATASLYYYVLTGVCLLLGFAGLVFSDTMARVLRARPLAGTVAVAWLVTVVRLLLEKSAAPGPLVEAIGVTWWAPVAGAYLAVALRPDALGLLALLLRYAFWVRAFVALVGVVATRLAAGTHYDVSRVTEVAVAFGGTWTFAPGSFEQLLWLVLLPQLVIWPAFTVLAGMAGGLVALRLTAPETRSATGPEGSTTTADTPGAG